MKFDLSEIKFSRNDIKKGIIIPEKMTDDLAEFIGIIVGDGHVGYYEKKTETYSYKHYEIDVAGNIDDLDYYENYVNKIIHNLFNIKFGFCFQRYMNVISLRMNSKAIHQFLSKIIGIPQRKDNITIPECILKSSRKRKALFLRGLADADFCFVLKYKPNAYPVINGTAKSKTLIKQCSEIISELGIKNCIYKRSYHDKRTNKIYTNHRVDINGFKRSKKFMKKVGFANSNKIKKKGNFILL